jgi:hypothetical protein
VHHEEAARRSAVAHGAPRSPKGGLRAGSNGGVPAPPARDPESIFDPSPRPADPRDPAEGQADAAARDIRDRLAGVMAAANRANVSVYPVDPRGVAGRLGEGIDIASGNPATLATLEDELRPSQERLRVLPRVRAAPRSSARPTSPHGQRGDLAGELPGRLLGLQTVRNGRPRHREVAAWDRRPERVRVTTPSGHPRATDEPAPWRLAEPEQDSTH